MAWCCQATSHCLNQCWPRTRSPYGVTRPQGVNKPLFQIMVYYFKKEWQTIAMMTGSRLYGWSPGLKWTDAIPPLCIWIPCLWVFTDNITIVHILTMKTESQILKPKFVFVFWYVLMVECYESMILCVRICKTMPCIFLEGTLTISRNFFKLKRLIRWILMIKFS